MTLKKWKVINVISIFLFSSLFHFIYDWFPTFFTSLFFPVNESIWEHNKIIVVSFLVLAIAEKLYYKKEKNDNPTRIGSTGNITVGFHKGLNLDELDIPDLAWVNAYANVVAGSDDHGNIWFQYKRDCKKEAVYTISGVINFTTLSFDKITKLD